MPEKTLPFPPSGFSDPPQMKLPPGGFSDAPANMNTNAFSNNENVPNHANVPPTTNVNVAKPMPLAGNVAPNTRTIPLATNLGPGNPRPPPMSHQQHAGLPPRPPASLPPSTTTIPLAANLAPGMQHQDLNRHFDPNGKNQVLPPNNVLPNNGVVPHNLAQSKMGNIPPSANVARPPLPSGFITPTRSKNSSLSY